MSFFYHFGRYLMMLRSCFTRPEKLSMYSKETFRQMVEIGVGSLAIISIMSLFIGAVTAVQFAYQLRGKWIPMWYIGIIVRDSMILELAPTMCCLLLAGKIGSNISSELGTMRISEQIDALHIMGINTKAYLVGPKIIAALIVIPLLLVFAVTAGILGGMGSGVTSGVYSTQEFIRGIQDPFKNLNLTVMFIKGFIFVFIITSVSCYQGYHASGGVIGVGKASTRSVVYSSILLVIADFLIAALVL